MSEIKLPPDLMQLPPYRHLRAALGSAADALLAWWLLFSELKRLAEEGGAPGRIGEAEAETFKKTLADVAAENGLKWPGEKTLFELLEEAKVVKRDGTDWLCQRYQVLNGDAFRPGLSSLGGSMKAYRSKERKLGQAAMQQSLNIHESKFVDGEGVTLASEMVDRVTRLIILCDNALFKPQRPPAGFTEGLIQSALLVVGKHKEEEIHFICEQVALHRSHPRLMGFTTERLLPQFSNMLRELGAE